MIGLLGVIAGRARATGGGPVDPGTPPGIGAFWAAAGGWYGGTVTYAHNGLSYHIVIADKSAEMSVRYSADGTTAPPAVATATSGADATSAAVWDGAANTAALVAAGAVFEAAGATDGLVHGGYSDWYLPARREQLTILQRLGSTAATAVAFAGGGSQRYASANYLWTSTAVTAATCSRNAQTTGANSSGSSTAYWPVRPFRRIPVV